MKVVTPQCLLLALAVLTAPLVAEERQFIRRGGTNEGTWREDGSRKLSFLSNFFFGSSGGSSNSGSSNSSGSGSTASDVGNNVDPPQQPSTRLPTRQPTRQPTRRPRGQPTRPPTRPPTKSSKEPTPKPTEKIATKEPSQGPTLAPSPSPSNTPTQSLGDDSTDGDSPSYWYPMTSNACVYANDYPLFMAQMNSTRYHFLSNTKEVCCANFRCDDDAVSTTAPSKQPSSAPSSSPTISPTGAETLLNDNDQGSAPSYWYPTPTTCIFSNDYPPLMSILNSDRYPFLSNSKEDCCANYNCDDVSISTPTPTDVNAPNPTPSPSPGSTSLTPTSREPTSGSPTSGSPTIVSCKFLQRHGTQGTNSDFNFFPPSSHRHLEKNSSTQTLAQTETNVSTGTSILTSCSTFLSSTSQAHSRLAAIPTDVMTIQNLSRQALPLVLPRHPSRQAPPLVLPRHLSRQAPLHTLPKNPQANHRISPQR